MGYLIPLSTSSSTSPTSLSKKSEAFNKAYQYIALGRKLESRRFSKCRLLCGVIIGTFLILTLQEELTKFVIHLQEMDIKTEFNYPLSLDNFTTIVNRFRLGILDEENMKQIKTRYSEVGFLNSAIRPDDWNKPVGLLIIVKSATRNYMKRDSIRKSWGDLEYLKKNPFAPNLPTKLVFICGIPDDFVKGEALFPAEEHFNDIVLADFNDNYSNNTYKSILALKWATTEFPSDYQFLFLVDDDMYVNLKNMISFVRTLGHRKVYKSFETDSSIPYLTLTPEVEDLTTAVSVPALADGLYMGTVYGSSYPVRTSNLLNYFQYGKKWFVTLAEYPFNLYPPYVPGAAIFMAKKTASDFYYASHFVEHFWIDDVYLGILAYRMKILALHNPNFNSKIKGFRQLEKKDFADLITLHGFSCPSLMYDLWHTRDLVKVQGQYC